MECLVKSTGVPARGTRCCVVELGSVGRGSLRMCARPVVRWSSTLSSCTQWAPVKLSLSGRGSGACGKRFSAVTVTAKVQAMDYTVIKAVCTELSTKWTPAKIERIVQADRFTLLISIRTVEESGWLRLCWNPACAHISVGDPPGGVPSIAEAFSFGEQLRYLLKGLAIIEVRIPQDWERVIELRLGARPSDPPSKHLFVEIMGRYSNVFLTNADMGVLACAYQVGAKMTSVRMVQVGGTYRLPPAAQGSLPSISMGMEEWKLITSATKEAKLQNSLVQAFRGVGPGLAMELIARSGLSPTMNVTTMTEEEWRSLHNVWLDWLGVLNESTFKPGLVRSTSSYSVLGGDSPYFLSTERDSEAGTSSVTTMLDDYYTKVYETEKFQQLRQQLVAKVSAATKKAQSKVNLFEDQIKASMGYGTIAKMGDLLMANLHVCEPGASSVTLPDFETEEPTTIALDPRQTALYTAQKLYKRSQKLRKSEKAVAPLLAEAWEELTYLSQVEVTLQQLDQYTCTTDLRSLEEVRDELVEGSYLKPIVAGTPPPSSKRKKKPSPLGNLTANMRRFTSPSGYEVLVGRNNRQNDVLTNRVATDYDLWFHARNIPGSHTVLRVPPGQNATDEDLQFSADLAAYFSKARGSGKVPVSYTSPKHLQKVKGGKPGMVKVEKESVLLGRASDPPEVVPQLIATT
ncbi:hypothetical protein M758_3G020500 [Ceratodon purpureus]|uniref:NFACT RNA-binding domain-containing protein n=1 Tax=Ceratodon purpureus TaxID=3225 RepID=A0A8T0IHJ2_CERPU|nr:hypothetical protein KC19_3G020500 [Ceratodon purpureus]KAG0621446.1 hypothetical protein M758_3G020500 [Ceratodon purpureus]